MPRQQWTKTAKRLLKQRHMSQERFARKINLSFGYLSRLLNSRHDPSLSLLERVAKGLGISVAELLR